MSIDSHLIHTCKIERPYEGWTNAHGLNTNRYRTIADDQACRLVIREQRMAATQAAEDPVITTYLLLLPGNSDIAQGDRISAVTIEDSQVLRDGFTVSAIRPRRARSQRHISVNLTRIT